MSNKTNNEAAETQVQVTAEMPAGNAAAGAKKSKAEKKAAKQLKKATKEAKKSQKAAKAKKGEKAEKKCKVFGCPIRNLIVTAVMSLLLGVAFVVEPMTVYTYCGYGIGGLAALVGVIYIIIYFARKPVSGMYRSEFAIGLVALLAGAYVAVGGLITGSSGTSVTFVTIVKILGILMGADGLMKLQYTLDVARMKYPRWWIGLIMSILGIALGVLTVMGIIYQLGESTSLGGMMMLGLAFCVNGLFDLAVMIVVAVRNHKAEKAAVLAEAEAILAAAKKEKDPDFFTEDDISAPEINAPAEKDISESVQKAESPAAPEPFFAPEPKIELAEQTPVPAPVEPEPAPEPKPEPILPDPVLASPTEDKQ